MMVITSAKSKNSSPITPAGHFPSRVKNLYLSPFKILVIILLVLLELSTVAVIAAPLNSDDEWTAVVVPITWSPAVTTTRQGLTSTQFEPLQKWWSSISAGYSNGNKFGRTVARSSPCYGTCCNGLSYHGINLGKNRDDEGYNDGQQYGKNQRVGNERGSYHYDKHCGENQHQKHCSKKQCDKPFGRNHHEQHCAKNRNGEGRHGINYNKQNKQQNMRNGNKRKEFIVDNKVIVNINNDRTSSPTLLQVETAVPVLVETTQKSVTVGLKNTGYNLWIIDLSVSLNCILTCFLILICFMCI